MNEKTADDVNTQVAEVPSDLPVLNFPVFFFLCVLCVLCGQIFSGPSKKLSHKGHKDHKEFQNLSVAIKGAGLNLAHQLEGIGQQLGELDDESGGVGAVDDAVVVRER